MDEADIRMQHLLPLYYEGKLDEKESQEVLNWIRLSVENQSIALQIKKVYQNTDTLYALNKVDTEKALNIVHNKMNKSNKVYLFMKWTQRVAAILSIPLLIITLVQYNRHQNGNETKNITLSTNPGMIASATLPDGTKVTLNSASSIVYPSHFDGSSRDIQLKGEAYFDVTKDKKHPFIVHTNKNASILVHGTKFDVETYSDDENITATLVSGSISLSYMKDSVWRSHQLTPGNKIVYSPEKQEIHVERAQIDVITSWKDGKLIFRNTPLNETLNSLSKRYNVEFVVKNPKCYENSFTGTLVNQRLERIMEYFHISSGMNFKYKEDCNIDKEKQVIEIY